eukprot:TRINITY_DN13983_c0_g1_i3.p1 TRINITY_DN13983_c0_g1~~TRINITY_DN13983_c0_g1_i3.p1  ORF type:complete len:272 (-),score=65.99 TRINITY_DN13983_c0_g1_i3:14-829(-)
MFLVRFGLVSLSLIALYLTWSNNLEFFSQTIRQRYPEESSQLTLLLHGFFDFFATDARPNRAASWVFDCITHHFNSALVFVASASLSRHLSNTNIHFTTARIVFEVVIYVIGALAIGLSFAFPLFCAIHASFLFTSPVFSPPRFVSSFHRSLCLLFLLAHVVCVAYPLLDVTPRLLDFFTFHSVGAFQISLESFLSSTMATFVAASLAWDTLLIAAPMALVMCAHRHMSLFSTLFVWPVLTLVMMVTGGAVFSAYWAIMFASSLSSHSKKQ